MDHGDVLEHRERLDRLLGLERAPEPPAGAAEVDHLEQVLAEGADRSRGGLDEAAEDVEERRLAGAVRPDQAAGAAREGDGHVVDRGHPREADGEVLDLDHGDFLRGAGGLRNGRDDQAPEVREVLRELLGDPAGGGQEHLQQADAEDDEEPVRVDAPLRWRMNGTSCMKTPATTAPQSVKMPPISAVAIRVSESCVGKP